MRNLFRIQNFWCFVGLLCAAGCNDEGQGFVKGSLEVANCDGDPKSFTCTASNQKTLEEASDAALLDAELSEPDADLSAESVDQSCESLDLEVDFFALESVEKLVTIRMQRGAQTIEQTNGLVLTIRDKSKIATGQKLPVGPQENIRAALFIFELCPKSTDSYAINGTITFDGFSTKSGKKVKGSFSDFVITDSRTGEVRGALHGEFDFTVEESVQQQHFPNAPDGWHGYAPDSK